MDQPVPACVCSPLHARCLRCCCMDFLWNSQNMTHLNTVFKHFHCQLWWLACWWCGVVVGGGGGLQDRAETLINILSYPAGLTDAEFSARRPSCISNLAQTPSVYVWSDFLPFSILPQQQGNRGYCVSLVFREQNNANAAFNTDHSVIFDHVCSWVYPSNLAVS